VIITRDLTSNSVCIVQAKFANSVASAARLGMVDMCDAQHLVPCGVLQVTAALSCYHLHPLSLKCALASLLFLERSAAFKASCRGMCQCSGLLHQT
jgi:hypothetical protein